jgi:hypothetical protein
MSTIGGGMPKFLKHKYQHHIPSENIPFVSTNLSSLVVVEGIKLDSLGPNHNMLHASNRGSLKGPVY